MVSGACMVVVAGFVIDDRFYNPLVCSVKTRLTGCHLAVFPLLHLQQSMFAPVSAFPYLLQ